MYIKQYNTCNKTTAIRLSIWGITQNCDMSHKVKDLHITVIVWDKYDGASIVTLPIKYAEVYKLFKLMRDWRQAYEDASIGIYRLAILPIQRDCVYICEPDDTVCEPQWITMAISPKDCVCEISRYFKLKSNNTRSVTMSENCKPVCYEFNELECSRLMYLFSNVLKDCKYLNDSESYMEKEVYNVYNV